MCTTITYFFGCCCIRHSGHLHALRWLHTQRWLHTPRLGRAPLGVFRQLFFRKWAQKVAWMNYVSISSQDIRFLGMDFVLMNESTSNWFIQTKFRPKTRILWAHIETQIIYFSCKWSFLVVLLTKTCRWGYFLIKLKIEKKSPPTHHQLYLNRLDRHTYTALGV